MGWQSNLPGLLRSLMDKTFSGFKALYSLFHIENLKRHGLLWSLVLFFSTFCLILFVLGILWSQEPEQRNVQQIALEKAGDDPNKIVPGFTTTATVLFIAETLLNKPGGYLSNDMFPPTSLFGIVQLLDNIPSWEFGALLIVRDTTRVLRNDFSRSQSQSLENKALAKAEPLFNFTNDSWLFPATESEYQQGIKHLSHYLSQLALQSDPNTQFFTRADNLNELLAVIEKRLGSLSKRLNASVEELRANTDLAGDTAAEQSTKTSGLIVAKTPWIDIDNVFYEARGYVWALAHLLRAVEVDFNKVLVKKNAVESLRQVIRLLEQAQVGASSPIVLNGDPMGWVANYSKSMVSYISPANSAIIDLRNLLARG
ncbi:MAG: DUF2333 family protein [Gammaproteobacteria bacterium]|nr:DUF2333 family protein [Gammaproteobacteria bacterium]